MNDPIKSEMRIAALEYMVSRLGAMLALALNLTPDRISKGAAALGDQVATQLFPHVGDAALSDHASAEYQAAVKRLLHMQTTLAEGLAKPPKA